MVFKSRVARFAVRRWTSSSSKATVAAVPEWATCVGSFRTSTPAQVRTTARDYSRWRKLPQLRQEPPVPVALSIFSV